MEQNKVFLEEYKKLNAKQKQAIDTLYGPVMVVAGPGTGKTQIIASRCANIILKTGTQPYNIFITTFTEAGVIAIKQRLQKFIGKESYKVYVSTIHSFAQDVISSFPEKFSEEKTGRSIDEVDSLEILREILQQEILLGNIETLRTSSDNLFYLRDIKSFIDKLKQEAVTPVAFDILIEKQNELYLQALEDLKVNKRIRDLEKRTAKDKQKYDTHISKLKEMSHIYKKYQKTLQNTQRYDYNDMIQFVVEKFRQDEDLRYYYAEKFQFIMLDEYQDTNNAQNEIISQILSVSIDSPNILVVGDDDQSIYRFQGANIENMLQFHKQYRDVQVIVLEENYRSSQDILDASDMLIENNLQRLVGRISGLEKHLVSRHPRFVGEQNMSVSFVHTPTDFIEKVYILDEIQKLLALGVPTNEIAIIVRGNKEVQAWTDFLIHNHIQAESKLKNNILNNVYVNFILDYLNFIIDPYFDEQKIIHLLRSKIIDIENIDIIRINKALYNENYKRKEKLKLFDVLFSSEFLEKIPLRSRQKILDFEAKYIALTQSIFSVNFSEFFDSFLKTTHVIEFIEQNGNFDDLQDVYTLFYAIKNFLGLSYHFSIKDFLSKIELYQTFGYALARSELRQQTYGVQVMTAHSSKGLEFEAVFIPGVYTGNWDGKKVIEKIAFPVGIVENTQSDVEENNDIEEERRLFFVATTRAKKHLTLTCPMSIEGKLKLVSEFVDEMGTKVEKKQSPVYPEQHLQNVVIADMSGDETFRHSSSEIEYIVEFLQSYRLSPSDLNVFLEDPKNFLHRVIFKYPFIDNEATIFGSVYHEVLEYFYKQQKVTGVWPDKDFLVKKFTDLLKRQSLSALEYARLEKKGIEGLQGYYVNYVGNFQTPFFVEYDFRPKKVMFQDIPLTGKIDKIVRIGDSAAGLFQKESVAIVDYKTGAIKYRGDIKGVDKDGNPFPGYEKGKYFRQLMFYKLLCEADYTFAQNYDVQKLYLDFAEGRDGKYKIEDVDFTQEEYQDFQVLLIDAAKKIFDVGFWQQFLGDIK